MVSTRSGARTAVAETADSGPGTSSSGTSARRMPAPSTPRRTRAQSRAAKAVETPAKEPEIVVIDDHSGSEPEQDSPSQFGPENKSSVTERGCESKRKSKGCKKRDKSVIEVDPDPAPAPTPASNADERQGDSVLDSSRTDSRNTKKITEPVEREEEQIASVPIINDTESDLCTVLKSNLPSKSGVASELPEKRSTATATAEGVVKDSQTAEVPASHTAAEQAKMSCTKAVSSINEEGSTKDNPTPEPGETNQDITEQKRSKSVQSARKGRIGGGVDVEGDHNDKATMRDGKGKVQNSMPEKAATRVKEMSKSRAMDEEKLAGMDAVRFLRRDREISQLCREIILDSYCQQSEVEFGPNLSKHQIVPQRRGKGRPPLGPIVSIETGEHFDSDQLWEEIELRNKPLLNHLHRRLQNIQTGQKKKRRKDTANIKLKTAKEKQEASNKDNEEMQDTRPDDLSSGSFEEGEEESARDDLRPDQETASKSPNEKTASKRRVSFALGTMDPAESKRKTPGNTVNALEDGFFSIADMEIFADDAEQLALAGKLVESDDDDSGSASSGTDDSDDENETEGAKRSEILRYSDFFDPPTSTKLKGTADKGQRTSQLLGAEDDEQVSHVGSVQTPFAASQARTRKMIEAIEEENIAKKPWQLRGEVTGHSRPKDSLLDAMMEHDTSGRLGVVIDEDRNETIEDIIRQRIVDGLFDDVIPAFPDEYQSDRKKKKELPEVSHEKPKESLADVYAREYLGEKEKARNELKSQEVQRDEKDAENDEQREVNRLYQKLAAKLDALSGLHYTPSAPKENGEMSVSNVVKAISSEEAIPEAVSDANVLTPKQVFSVNTKDRTGEKEKTKAERKSARGRAKMSKRKANHAKARAAQLMEQANPVQAEKRRAEEALLRRGKKIKVAARDGFKSQSSLTLAMGSSKASRVKHVDEAIQQSSAKPSASSLVL